MSWRDRATWAISILGSALAFTYVLVWLHLTASQVRHTDFVAGYTGGTLLRTSGGDNLYNLASQNFVFAHAILPEKFALLPFTWAPVGALLLAPFSWLSLLTAYRIESLLAVALMVAAALLVVRAGFNQRDRRQVVPAVLAIAGMPAFYLLIQGQLVGITAMGIALAYWYWRKNDWADGAVWLGFLASAIKPHLAIGIAVFVIGWGERAVIRGALVGVAGAVVLSLLTVGGPGTAGFISSSLFTANVWPKQKMVTVFGLATSVLGSNNWGLMLGVVLAICVLLACFFAGRQLAKGRWSLEVALSICCVLTVLASPHAYLQDLAIAVLALPLVWIHLSKNQGGTNGMQLALVFLAWLIPNLLAIFILGSSQSYTGVLMPVGLALAIGLVWLSCKKAAVANA